MTREPWVLYPFSVPVCRLGLLCPKMRSRQRRVVWGSRVAVLKAAVARDAKVQLGNLPDTLHPEPDFRARGRVAAAARRAAVQAPTGCLGRCCFWRASALAKSYQTAMRRGKLTNKVQKL